MIGRALRGDAPAAPPPPPAGQAAGPPIPAGQRDALTGLPLQGRRAVTLRGLAYAADTMEALLEVDADAWPPRGARLTARERAAVVGRAAPREEADDADAEADEDDDDEACPLAPPRCAAALQTVAWRAADRALRACRLDTMDGPPHDATAALNVGALRDMRDALCALVRHAPQAVVVTLATQLRREAEAILGGLDDDVRWNTIAVGAVARAIARAADAAIVGAAMAAGDAGADATVAAIAREARVELAPPPPPPPPHAADLRFGRIFGGTATGPTVTLTTGDRDPFRFMAAMLNHRGRTVPVPTGGGGGGGAAATGARGLVVQDVIADALMAAVFGDAGLRRGFDGGAAGQAPHLARIADGREFGTEDAMDDEEDEEADGAPPPRPTPPRVLAFDIDGVLASASPIVGRGAGDYDDLEGVDLGALGGGGNDGWALPPLSPLIMPPTLAATAAPTALDELAAYAEAAYDADDEDAEAAAPS